MPRSPQVDAYIKNAPEFAQPVLEKIRAAFQKASPRIEESIKWRAPAFEYNGMLGGMAAFKAHVALRFWKGTLMSDPEGLFDDVGTTAMVGIRLESLEDLPTQKVLVAYVKEAIRLNAEGAKAARRPSKPVPKASTTPPPDLAAALKKNRRARETFAGFSPSNKRDYVEWLTEAKREATRAKRLATAIEWLAEGKPRNWKYTRGNC